MSAARETIFAAIHAALAPLPRRETRPHVPLGVAEPQWLGAETDNVALFLRRARATGTVCFTSLAECEAWLLGQKAAKVYLADSLAAWSSQLGAGLDLTLEYHRDQVDVIDAALTPAAGAIAESGSIIMTDGSSPDRLSELAPWIHIAVVQRETIHRSIAEAIAAMPDDPNIIWVTGPSKTADVEGILIQGVHGPGVQACLLV